MATRRVFFSFDYKQDSFRASRVRNTWVTEHDHESAGYIDAADWKYITEGGDEAIKQWINSNLKDTSVTVVLISSETSKNEWVNYGIQESLKKGNGILGIYINNIEDLHGMIDSKGENPLDIIYVEDSNPTKYLSEIYDTYDWVNDNGYSNLHSWVEAAAKQVEG